MDLLNHFVGISEFFGWVNLTYMFTHWFEWVYCLVLKGVIFHFIVLLSIYLIVFFFVLSECYYKFE